MSATNLTKNLKLSQFVASDKPSWLGDVNGDHKKIDDGYGVLAETDIYDAVVKGIKNKKLTNINFIQEQNPNGKMKFPDYIIDKFWLDSKAVKCDKNKNGTYQAHYSNGLGDKDEIISILDKFFTNNTLDEKSSALIIYTYYFPLEDCVYNIKLKVVPLLFCIGVAEKK